MADPAANDPGPTAPAELAGDGPQPFRSGSSRPPEPPDAPLIGAPPPPKTAIVAADAAPPDAAPSGSHPVRDRLLAKARAVATPPPPVASPRQNRESSVPALEEPRASASPSDSWAEPPQGAAAAPSGPDSRASTAPRSALDAELDEIVGPDSRLPLAGRRKAGGSLPPNGTLLLAGLLGATALASLFALLIQLAPNREAPQTVPTAPSVASADPSVPDAPSVQPEAPPPRKTLPGPWRITSAASGEKLIRGQIGKEPFLKAIQSAGLSRDQAYRVYGALKETRNLDRCRPKDEFIALLDRASGRVTAFEYVVSPAEIYQAKEKDGQLEGKQLDLKVERGRVQGAIIMSSSSFADAARAAHFDPGLGRVINQALDGHSAVEEFALGDRLRVVAQEVTILGEFYRYSGIEALEYIPKEGDPLRIYYNAARKRYYDARGRSPGEGGFRKPCKGAPITSRFNPKRMHPILKKRMPHNGTDFGAPTGTPVGATAPGEVVKRGLYGPNGNFIAIKHRGGYETGYSHLSRFEPGLEVGAKVSRMQIIGYVGSTGRSTGPHLHFSAKKDGRFIDPESLQLDALTVLAKSERDKFEPVRRNYDKLLDEVALPPQLVAPAPDSALAAPGGPLQADPILGAAATLPAVAPEQREGTQGLPPAAPANPQPAAAPPSAPATPRARLYLDDEELIESQSATDDGEVAE